METATKTQIAAQNSNDSKAESSIQLHWDLFVDDDWEWDGPLDTTNFRVSCPTLVHLLLTASGNKPMQENRLYFWEMEIQRLVMDLYLGIILKMTYAIPTRATRTKDVAPPCQRVRTK